MPGEPGDVAAVLLVELRKLVFAVGAGRNSDGPIGMEMIDVREGKEGVKRSVDGGGHFVLTEGGQRVEADHFIFVSFAAIQTFEFFEAIKIKQGET